MLASGEDQLLKLR